MTEASAPTSSLRRAMDRHRAGEFEEARRLYGEHLRERPDDVEALCLLAALEGQAGDHRGAESIYRQAIEADAGYGPAHGGLGASLLLQDRPADAGEALTQAVRLMPEQPELRLQLALAWQRCGRLQEARDVLGLVAERWPDHLPGRHSLALVLDQCGEPDAAAAQFRFVVDRDPSRFESWLGLGRALMAANDPVGAEEALERAAALVPDSPEPKTMLGKLMRARGRFPEAKAAFDAALDADPGHPATIVGLAELDLAEGRIDRGLARLAPLAEGDAPARSALRTTARLLIADGRSDEAVSRIDGWLESLELLPVIRAGLLSLKGRALDDLGDADAAWRAWSESHVLRPSRFDGRHFTFAIEQLIDAYGAELFASRCTEAGAGEPGVLLVVGTPRSGKSILEHILACHPQVRGAGELRYLGALSHEVARRAGDRDLPYPACISAVRDRDLIELGESYRRATAELAAGARWVVDTQPTNFLHLGLAALLRPDIKVVVCRRDPLDTAWACFRTQFADPGLDFASSPEGIARYLSGMSRLLRHWRSVIPVEILEIAYEDLVRSPRDIVGEVIAYLGLEWDERVMGYALPGRSRLAGPPAVDRPLDDAEIGRGAPYRDRFTEVLQVAPDGDHVP